MSDSGRLPPSLLERAESTTGSARARELGDASPFPLGEDHQWQLLAAEIRLLFENAYTGVVITVIIAALLAYAQRDVVPQAAVLPWLAYMLVVSIARAVLARRYWRASSTEMMSGRWNRAFVDRKSVV